MKAVHLLLVLLTAPAAAAPRAIASFDDDADDLSYVAPKDTEFTDGDFDLRRFAVFADGEDVLFEVTLGAPIRRPAVSQRTQQTDLPLWNDIYLQNVDIYVDTDPGRAGYTSCIPGRRVGFADGRSWKAAVVLTPQPGPARSIANEAMGEAARHVIFAQGLEVRGRSVVARVSAAALGGAPTAKWGYSVQVSGAQWERSFSVTDRLRGTREVNAFTMPVLTIPEAFAFGGAPAGELHPRVVDVLLPHGADQKAVLRSYDEATGAFARIPFVYAQAPAAVAAATRSAAAEKAGAAKPGPELSIAYIAGNMISLSGAAPGLEPMQFGTVLGPDGAPVARVVIVQIVEGGVVATAVENRDKIVRGARVRFDVTPSRSRQ